MIIFTDPDPDPGLNLKTYRFYFTAENPLNDQYLNNYHKGIKAKFHEIIFSYKM